MKTHAPKYAFRVVLCNGETIAFPTPSPASCRASVQFYTHCGAGVRIEVTARRGDAESQVIERWTREAPEGPWAHELGDGHCVAPRR